MNLTTIDMAAKLKTIRENLTADAMLIGNRTVLDACLDLLRLAGDVERAVSLPPVSGGAPEGDDNEDSFEFNVEPRPVVWRELHDGEDFTPVEVLAASLPRYEPTPEDWVDYYAAR